MKTDKDVIRELRGIIQELEEDAKQLRELLAPQSLADFLAEKFRLGQIRARYLSALVAHGYRSYPQLMSTTYWDRDAPENSGNIAKVMAHHINKALVREGYRRIKTVWGAGLRLDDDTRRKILAEYSAAIEDENVGS